MYILDSKGEKATTPISQGIIFIRDQCEQTRKMKEKALAWMNKKILESYIFHKKIILEAIWCTQKFNLVILYSYSLLIHLNLPVMQQK